MCRMSRRTEQTPAQTQLGKQKFTIYLHNHRSARIFTSDRRGPGLWGGGDPHTRIFNNRLSILRQYSLLFCHSCLSALTLQSTGPGNLRTEASVNTTPSNHKSKLRLSRGLQTQGVQRSSNELLQAIILNSGQRKQELISVRCMGQKREPSNEFHLGTEESEGEREVRRNNKNNTVAQREPAGETRGP